MRYKIVALGEREIEDAFEALIIVNQITQHSSSCVLQLKTEYTKDLKEGRDCMPSL